MSSKHYPKVIVLKKGVIGLVALIVSLIAVLIIHNIYSSTHATEALKVGGQNKSLIESLATANDTSWYSAQNIRKTSPVENVPTNAASSEQPLPKSSQLASSSHVEEPKVVSEIDARNQQALIDAMSAPISSNQLTAQNGRDLEDSPHLPSTAISSLENQSAHDEKNRFLEINQRAGSEVLLQHIKKPISPFEIKAGSNIPGVLIGGINSDLPGEITALVRSNVFDSVSGNYVLVPQGATLKGIYDSDVAYAQQRLLVVWKRIIFPNGDSLNLEGMPGTDLNGYAGFGDEVDNHYGKIFGSVILGSVISAGAQLSQPQNTVNSPFAAPSIGQTMAQSLGTNIANTTVAITNKNIGIPPTITIRPGYKFNIKVTKDLVFEAPYED
jgi:type IV secretory pathway VirB10-like protein